MLYSIIAQDNPDSLALRRLHVAEHRQRLAELTKQGRMLFAGPNPAVDAEDPSEAGFSGSVIIAEFADLATAQAWADSDIYLAKGVYSSVQVKPVKKVFP